MLHNHQVFGQRDYEESFAIDLAGLDIKNALNKISDSSGYYFAFVEGISIELNDDALINYDEITLNQLLIKLTHETEVKYLFRQNQIILKKRKKKVSKKYLTGQVFDSDTQEPLPYCAIELKKKYKGTIADYNGKFKILLNEIEQIDTLLISSLGYAFKEIPFAEITNLDSLIIQLPVKQIVFRPVTIVNSKYKELSVGETGKKSQGEMYVDTNGQQTALYIDNQNQQQGKIEKLTYYLSHKGNINAPFRVHIYAVDDNNGGPGKDLLEQFVIAKPRIDKGWYELDILAFDINIPENGFYVAMEGVFPDNPESIVDLKVIDKKKKRGLRKKKANFIKILSYGQRLGFKKAKKNLTWHYSLSGNWFQLERQSFNVMIGAELLVEPKSAIE